MGPYFDPVLTRIKKMVSLWTDGFEESPEYARLSSAQKAESRPVIDIFAELMYAYYLEVPEKWSVSGLEECCLDLFPSKLAAEPEFYEAVEPVLTAFFAYIHRKGYISNAAELTSRLKKVAGDMIERASCPETSKNDAAGNPAAPEGATGAVVYQLKITIRDINPPIWRRLLVPQGITFSKLHRIIQAAFGWQNYHLYRFDFGDTVVTEPDPDYAPGELYSKARELNSKRTKIDGLLRSKRTCVYTYDFGDNWNHDVVLEDILPAEGDRTYPVCVAGARQRPPEDVGGVGGYEEFLEAISDPENPKHDELLIWAEKDTGGVKFDPEYFYILGINRALAKIK